MDGCGWAEAPPRSNDPRHYRNTPLLDGDGRVARLMSNAVLLDALDTGAVWSVARGVARHFRSIDDILLNAHLEFVNG